MIRKPREPAGEAGGSHIGESANRMVALAFILFILHALLLWSHSSLLAIFFFLPSFQQQKSYLAYTGTRSLLTLHSAKATQNERKGERNGNP
jgi:hypothetical protein